MMFSQFNSNCTLPPTITNWVSQPNSRGTFDILWTSLTTLFLCTWSVQHPNVPSLENGDGYKFKFIWVMKKLRMMISTLIFPEFLLLKSVSDNSAARFLTKQVEWRTKSDGVRWSKTHSYFANMGGFVIDFSDLMKADLPPSSSSLDIKDKNQVQTRMFSGASSLTNVQTDDSITPIPVPTSSPSKEYDCEMAVQSTIAILENKLEASDPSTHKEQKLSPHQALLMRIITMVETRLPELEHPHTYLVRDAFNDLKELARTEDGARKTKEHMNNKVINLARLRSRYWALDGAQLTLARDLGIISRLPDVEESCIEDKTGSDALAKFLAVLQTLWQIVELLQRWANHESSSQLEVVTVAYCACTFFIYVMFWSKPQDVDRPFLITPARWPTKEEMLQIADRGPASELGLFTGFQYDIPEDAIHDVRPGEDSGPASGRFAGSGAVFGGVIFGLIHCVAWNFRYPTIIERTLWRVSSTVTAAVPILFALRFLCGMQRLERRFPVIIDFFMPALAGTLGLVYVFCRALLLVETFRSLAFLPPDSYRKM